MLAECWPLGSRPNVDALAFAAAGLTADFTIALAADAAALAALAAAAVSLAAAAIPAAAAAALAIAVRRGLLHRCVSVVHFQSVGAAGTWALLAR